MLVFIFILFFCGGLIIFAVCSTGKKSVHKKIKAESLQNEAESFQKKAAEMSTPDLSVRLSILFDELEDRYDEGKALEYKTLLREYLLRPDRQ